MPMPRMRADHSIARTLSSFDANRGTSASTRASPGLRAQISSAMRSTPAGRGVAQRGDDFERAVVGDERDDVGRVEVGVGAQAGERVPHLGRERVGLERRDHLGARRVDVAFEIGNVRPRDVRGRDRAGEPAVGRVLDAREHFRAPCGSSSCNLPAASRKSPRSGRVAFSRTMSAQASTSHGRCELSRRPATKAAADARTSASVDRPLASSK